MNTLITSLFHQVQNDSIFIQHRLRVIHESLLQCLTDTAAINKKQDYHRGELHLTKRMQGSPFSALLRLFVSRSGVDIYETGFWYPDLKIIRKTGGRYTLLDGKGFDVLKKNTHLPCSELPIMLGDFSEQRFNPASEAPKISFSRVS